MKFIIDFNDQLFTSNDHLTTTTDQVAINFLPSGFPSEFK